MCDEAGVAFNAGRADAIDMPLAVVLGQLGRGCLHGASGWLAAAPATCRLRFAVETSGIPRTSACFGRDSSTFTRGAWSL
mmetsp:Transcript_1734/g.3751  ORF Transcript_1734/g.3751 Transcript_1734/m.3751 type:complete len:80 (-) Transcript_1734:496-735(-)